MFSELGKMAILLKLKQLLEEKRGKLKDIKQENTEYDEEFAKIGQAEEEPEETEEE